jgi:hypothetical protein
MLFTTNSTSSSLDELKRLNRSEDEVREFLKELDYVKQCKVDKDKVQENIKSQAGKHHQQ